MKMKNICFFVRRLYWITKRAGEKEGSGLMKANAWHHRSDAISSVVALIGVGKTFLLLSIIVTMTHHHHSIITTSPF